MVVDVRAKCQIQLRSLSASYHNFITLPTVQSACSIPSISSIPLRYCYCYSPKPIDNAVIQPCMMTSSAERTSAGMESSTLPPSRGQRRGCAVPPRRNGGGGGGWGRADRHDGWSTHPSPPLPPPLNRTAPRAHSRKERGVLHFTDLLLHPTQRQSSPSP